MRRQAITPEMLRVLAKLGYGRDTRLAHVSPGEMVLNPQKIKALLPAISKQYARYGQPLASRIVGPGAAINPKTGLPSFEDGSSGADGSGSGTGGGEGGDGGDGGDGGGNGDGGDGSSGGEGSGSAGGGEGGEGSGEGGEGSEGSGEGEGGEADSVGAGIAGSSMGDAMSGTVGNEGAFGGDISGEGVPGGFGSEGITGGDLMGGFGASEEGAALPGSFDSYGGEFGMSEASKIGGPFSPENTMAAPEAEETAFGPLSKDPAATTTEAALANALASTMDLGNPTTAEQGMASALADIAAKEMSATLSSPFGTFSELGEMVSPFGFSFGKIISTRNSPIDQAIADMSSKYGKYGTMIGALASMLPGPPAMSQLLGTVARGAAISTAMNSFGVPDKDLPAAASPTATTGTLSGGAGAEAGNEGGAGAVTGGINWSQILGNAPYMNTGAQAVVMPQEEMVYGDGGGGKSSGKQAVFKTAAPAWNPQAKALYQFGLPISRRR